MVALLPDGFGDLECFVADWVLPDALARMGKRLSSNMEEIRAFYAAMLPRGEAALAYLDAWLGLPGQIAAALALLAATMLAWWRRLGEEPGGREKRVLAMAFLFVGTSLGLSLLWFNRSV